MISSLAGTTTPPKAARVGIISCPLKNAKAVLRFFRAFLRKGFGGVDGGAAAIYSPNYSLFKGANPQFSHSCENRDLSRA
jgi:hypothetical protein